MTEKQYNEYLVHHGILGQKWGKKNGPPYPLDASDHSASEKKQGTRGWSRAAKAEIRKKSKTLSDDDLKKDNTRKALEKQYIKNHQEDVDAQIDRAWKVTENTKTAINAASKLASDVEKATRKTVSTSNIDISKLSDKELQQIVSRMNLEAQYNRMTSKEVYNKGAVAAREALEVVGSLVAIAGGIVTIKKALG